MNALEMTDNEFYEMGLKILTDRLGASEVPRFIRQCQPGKGNCSVNRHKLLANQPDIDTIVKRIEKRKAERKEEERIKSERVAAWRKGVLELTNIEIYELAVKILMDKLHVYGYIGFLQQHFKHLNGDQSQQSLPDSGVSITPNQRIRATDPQD